MAETIATPPATVVGAHAVSSLLSVQHAEKVFGAKGNLTHALDGVSLNIAQGEFAAIMGPSGSGKTTLLNCISTIDRLTNGRILIKGRDIMKLSTRALAKFRRDELGFIFQDSNLLDTLTAYENIALALTIKGVPSSQIPARINDIARKLGVDAQLNKYPNQMSGGQCQRVAAARAIVCDPSLILADEPTGALDSLEGMNKNFGATILMVTHDAYAASFTSRVLFLSDGRIFNEVRRGDLSREDYFGRIMEVVTFLGGEARHVG